MLRDKAQEFYFREREKGGGEGVGREGGRKRVKEKTICLYYNKLAIAIVGKIVSIIIGGFCSLLLVVFIFRKPLLCCRPGETKHIT